MTQLAIIDYGAGNLLSLSRAVQAVGATPTITTDPAVVAAADGVILPGVGAAGSAMNQLAANGMVALLRTTPQPLLGICLGMQLFFDHTEEDDCDGLGLIAGQVRRLRPAPDVKVPHMGWNRVTWAAAPGPLFDGLTSGGHYYFVHSFTCEPAHPGAWATAWTEHGAPVCAAIGTGRLWGLQFHPEKSSDAGLLMLRNFVTLVQSTEGAE